MNREKLGKTLALAATIYVGRKVFQKAFGAGEEPLIEPLFDVSSLGRESLRAVIYINPDYDGPDIPPTQILALTGIARGLTQGSDT